MISAIADTAAVCAWPPGAPQLWARALGQLEDLDIDFAAPRPYAVTQILERCVADAPGARAAECDVWQWTVPQRTQGLLAVAAACALPAVEALARCASAECGEQIELDLDLASLGQTTQIRVCTWRGAASEVLLRLPTGDDQRCWLDTLPADADDAAAAIGASLISGIDGDAPPAAWRLPQQWLPGIEEALAEHDPTTALTVETACPRCGEALDIEVDLEGLLLGAFARMQRDLLLSVHLIASRYHWSETQVVALPTWRRAYYLAALGSQDSP